MMADSLVERQSRIMSATHSLIRRQMSADPGEADWTIDRRLCSPRRPGLLVESRSNFVLSARDHAVLALVSTRALWVNKATFRSR